MNDIRHNARIIALQKLFESSFPGIIPQDNSEQGFAFDSLKELDEISDIDSLLIQKLLLGVINNYQLIDEIIFQLAPDWPINKINKVDLQILRIAILEGFLVKITPEKVAINEAIELSKEFSNEQSRRFVNGVLGNLLINQKKILTDEILKRISH
ncbi:MAG: transcription antitermination factor NusB [bacterium]